MKSPINRRQYATRMVILLVITVLLGMVQPEGVGPGHNFFINLGAYILATTFTAQRLRDMQRIPWWSLLMFAPFANLLLIIWCLAAKTKAVAMPLADVPAPGVPA